MIKVRHEGARSQGGIVGVIGYGLGVIGAGLAIGLAAYGLSLIHIWSNPSLRAHQEGFVLLVFKAN